MTRRPKKIVHFFNFTGFSCIESITFHIVDVDDFPSIGSFPAINKILEKTSKVGGLFKVFIENTYSALLRSNIPQTLSLWTPTIFIGKEQRINIYGTPSKVGGVHL
jgi:hypothetical protein